MTGHSFIPIHNITDKTLFLQLSDLEISYIKSTVTEAPVHLRASQRAHSVLPGWSRGGWRYMEGQSVLKSEVTTRNTEPGGRNPCCNHMLNHCPPRERAPTGSFSPRKCSEQGRPVWPWSCRLPHCMPNHCSWSAHWAASLSLPSRSPSSPLPSMSSTSSS